MGIAHQFAGEFEAHLTVRPPADESQLADWAAAHGLRYARILLDRGLTSDQPMLTFTRSGTVEDMMRVVQTHTHALDSAGFALVRTKIEASPYNAQIPQTAEQVASVPAGCYFEHHIKLLLSGNDDVTRVRVLAQPHAAHVSRNARRSAGNGCHERFVTQRCRGVALPEAGRQLDSLLKDLDANDFSVIEVEREFVVHDDCPGLDAGWITETAAGAP
ncbi:hypothetical protein [Nocardia sp. NPDC047038]|uniref:hypothetical protein n=1 Tax=Nocardia sp. NPDC047038 TaxID=3154338 RepID=UPI0033F99615